MSNGLAGALVALAGTGLFGALAARLHLLSRGRRAMSATLARAIPLAVVSIALAAGASGATPASADSCPNARFRTGPSTALPDCRAYEQVSPAEKGGFAALPEGASQYQVTPDGEAIAYIGVAAFPGAQGNTALFAGHLARRTAGGWQGTELTPAVPQAPTLSVYTVAYAFTPDLTHTFLKVPLVPLTPEATPNVFNLFDRAANGSYRLIDNAAPAVPPSHEVCPEEEPLSSCFFSVDVSAFAGATPDAAHVLFESTAQLTAEAPETGTESLYESSGGHVRLVGVLPDGKPSRGSTAGAGTSVSYVISTEQRTDHRAEHAISADGTHVVFEAPADEGQPDPAQNELTEVYDRVGAASTIELSAPAPGAEPKVTTPEPAQFWAASEDGQRVFFTSAAELTTASNTGEANNSEDLYEYDVTHARLTDLTVDSNPADASTGAGVQGVVDISRDGSYVYFVAKGQLVAGEGIGGQPNLYVEHDGGPPVFIATLTGEECELGPGSTGDACDWAQFPAQLEAYVTPDGRHLAFMSKARLATTGFPSGYDNTDAATGKPDSEVYEYTAGEGAAAGQLTCASCDPSGAPPVSGALLGGIAHTVLEHGEQVEQGTSSPFYRVPAASEDGSRVFFTAAVPGQGSRYKVFEYERTGAGSCADPRGCIFELSSPSIGEDQDFYLGASASGNDVYIATRGRLVAGDQDSSRDVYDVRVGGGFPEGNPQAPCSSGCRQASAAEGEAGTSLLSAGLGPSGNLPAPAAGAAPSHAARCTHGRRLVHRRCVKPPKRHCTVRHKHRVCPRRTHRPSTRRGRRR